MIINKINIFVWILCVWHSVDWPKSPNPHSHTHRHTKFASTEFLFLTKILLLPTLRQREHFEWKIYFFRIRYRRSIQRVPVLCVYAVCGDPQRDSFSFTVSAPATWQMFDSMLDDWQPKNKLFHTFNSIDLARTHTDTLKAQTHLQ